MAALSILALALGIGANTAIFSVVQSVLLRPLEYRDPDRLVVLEHPGPSPAAPATYLDWKHQAASFDQMAAAQAWGGSLRTSGRPEAIIGLKVSANLFDLLGVPPLAGRTFLASEDRDEAAPVVVLSHSLWQRSFAGSADVLGRQADIDGVLYTVVGVMPPSFRFAPFWVTKAEIWTPLVLGQRKTDRTGQSLRVFARLRPGVSLERAQAEMNTIMDGIAQQHPGSNAKDRVQVEPLLDRVVGNVRPMLLVLAGTVAFVLLIACANVANLMLSKAAGRRKEMAIRLALGATPGQLARLTLFESAGLALLGGGLGFLLAQACIRTLHVLTPAETLPRQTEAGLDPGVLAFTAAVSLLTGALSGFLPAWQAAQANVNARLQEGGRGAAGGVQTQRSRNALVMLEVCLAFVLLIGAGLMTRSFALLLSQDGGFDPKNLLTFEVSVAGTKHADPSRRLPFYEEVRQRVSSLPGVRSASLINHAPITGDVWGMQYRVENRELPRPGEWPNAIYRVADTGYLPAMQTPILEGRDFASSDAMNSPRVAIVNRTLARAQWPGRSAIGERIVTREGVAAAVIGVAQDMKQTDWRSSPREEIYFPLRQSPRYLTEQARHFEFLSVVVRLQDGAGDVSTAIRHAVASVDPDVLVSNMIRMERAVANNTGRTRLALFLFSVLSLIAFGLAITGVYGVISQAVSQRTQEIGIRMAMGAAPGQVLRSSLVQALAPVASGLTGGALLALVLTRWMQSLLFGVRPTDPLTFALVIAVMLVSGMLAALRPALKAARVDPLVALRHQ